MAIEVSRARTSGRAIRVVGLPEREDGLARGRRATSRITVVYKDGSKGVLVAKDTHLVWESHQEGSEDFAVLYGKLEVAHTVEFTVEDLPVVVAANKALASL
jgi:hypothetical protein